MSVLEGWTEIASRIAATVEAMDALVRLSTNGEDSYGVHKEISARNRAALIELRNFEERHRAVLPEPVRTIIVGFVSGERANLIGENPDLRRAKAGSLFLGLLAGEVTRLLANQDLVVRMRTERAFRHLQQVIATDPNVQAKWTAALDAGEVACERLGATHLLWQCRRFPLRYRQDAGGARV